MQKYYEGKYADYISSQINKPDSEIVCSCDSESDTTSIDEPTTDDSNSSKKNLTSNDEIEIGCEILSNAIKSICRKVREDWDDASYADTYSANVEHLASDAYAENIAIGQKNETVLQLRKENPIQASVIEAETSYDLRTELEDLREQDS